MLNIIYLANWGPGLEVLKVLTRSDDVDIKLVVSRFNKESKDKWYNAVTQYAHEKGLQLVNEETVSFQWLRDFIVSNDIDVMVCFSFMRVLPREVFDAPRLGSVNIHPSLLPKYRGPSPAYWALKKNEQKTGLTTHFIDDGIDTGDIISHVEISLEPDDNIVSLLEKQKKVVGKLITRTIKLLKDKNFVPTRQEEAFASYAPRPK